MPASGPCADWCTLADVRLRAACSDSADVPDATLTDIGIPVASDVLWRLSGHRWPGVCSATVRPVRVAEPSGPAWSGPGWDYGWQVFDLLGYSRQHVAVDEIVDVTEVRVDGDVLDPATYRVDDGRWLIRLPDVGETTRRAWPTHQRLDLPVTEDDTWQVVFTYGSAPPPSGEAACAALACEIGRLIAGDSGCVLAEHVTQVTREGITYDLVTAGSADRESGFGIFEVRVFLDAVNPHGLSRQGRLLSPDVPVRRVVVADTAAGS